MVSNVIINCNKFQVRPAWLLAKALYKIDQRKNKLGACLSKWGIGKECKRKRDRLGSPAVCQNLLTCFWVKGVSCVC